MKNIVLQGIRQSLAVWTQEGFAKMLRAYRDTYPHGDSELEAIWIPLPILQSIEDTGVDFLAMSGRHFNLVNVFDYTDPWFVDMLWAKNLFEVPILKIWNWDSILSKQKDFPPSTYPSKRETISFFVMGLKGIKI